MKRILILTAAFGEGHNTAARSLRDALLHLAPTNAEVTVADLFAEVYGIYYTYACKSYAGAINRAPRLWGKAYQWLDSRQSFAPGFKLLAPVRHRLAATLARLRPDVVVSVYPAYFHLLDEIMGRTGTVPFQRVTVVTDSISINSIWLTAPTDVYIVPNEQTREVLLAAGIVESKVKALGFPVARTFAEPQSIRPTITSETKPCVLSMISSQTETALDLVRELSANPDIELTITVGRNEPLQRAVEAISSVAARPFRTVGWTDKFPELLLSTHLLIGKAGGATVQEAIASRCPIIVNQIVPGQEEGNATLIAQTRSGVIATSNREVLAAVNDAFVNDAELWRQWAANIEQLGRPDAAFTIARFLQEL